jgi:uncharacterized membrane protein
MNVSMLLVACGEIWQMVLAIAALRVVVQIVSLTVIAVAGGYIRQAI